jgi:hypothetical protein
MAGLGRKIFTAGDVLTASDTMNYLMDQTVMNFAGTAARSSAIATPTTGMTTYNQTTKQLETYNGSAYIGMSGLQLVKKQTIGSGVTSVTVTGAFSATYDAYKIVVTGGTTSANNDNLNLQLGSTTTDYYAGGAGITYATGASALTSQNNTSSWQVGFAQTNGLALSVDLVNPFLSSRTFMQGSLISSVNVRNIAGVLANTNSHTAFTITAASADSLTGGTIYVYGYGV